MKEISITDIEGILIGQVEDRQAATGVTVIICPEGMPAGIDVRGGGPASRDTRVLDPLASAELIHAVVLSGGSAFGLEASTGVQKYLEERRVGLAIGSVHVPLVCQSSIFDLLVGSSSFRVDAKMGYAACEAAAKGNYKDGNYGAGCGATVGKVLGPAHSMKTGIGSYAVQLGELKVGAIVVVNAVGDVTDPATGKLVAGLINKEHNMLSSARTLYKRFEHNPDDGKSGREQLVTNTTIGAIITNAKLTKAQLCKLASMGQDGMARTIRPVHTSMDGDSLYGLSVGDVEANLDLVGTLGADCVAKAILVAARSADSAYGLMSAKDIEG